MSRQRSAIRLADSGNGHEGLRTSYALTGDTEGAIADFEFAIQWADETGTDPAFIESRQAWVKALRAGEKPFDEETLAALRAE